MNRFRRQLEQKEDSSNDSASDYDPFNQLKLCKDKLKDMSDVLKNLSNKL